MTKIEVIRVRRGNVILDIPSSDKDLYMSQGYSVIDEKTGSVIEEAMPTDVNTLQAMVGELKLKVSKLESEIATLKAPKKSNKTETKAE